MKCRLCGQGAKEFTIDRGGREYTVRLCDFCYRRLYLKLEPLLTEEGHAAYCPVCKTTMEDFKRTGLVGCAQCYRTFYAELLPTIVYVQQTPEQRKLQAAPKHRGRLPNTDAQVRYQTTRDLLAQRERLKAEAERAISNKDGTLADAAIAQIIEIRKKLRSEEE